MRNETEAQLDLQQMIGGVRRRLLTIPQVAEYLNLSPKYLYNRCHRKSKNPLPFPVKRIGRRCLVDIRDLQKFVSEL
jgi:hypothetical protein